MSEAIWQFANFNPAHALKIQREAGVQKAAAEVFASRGITDVAQLREWSDMPFAKVRSPHGLPDIERVVDRLERAINHDELVFVWGDYDVDGITSTTLVVSAMRMMGGRVTYQTPHRLNDGYDVKMKSVDLAQAVGAKVLMTVDCGIRATEVAEYAATKGLDLIITDHHHPRDDGVLPACLGVVNPSREDSTYGFAGLCGCGVAFKVMLALGERFGIPHKEMYRQYLDLVALGTVADVVPLVDENRVLVHHGLEALRNTVRPGLQALMRAGNVSKVDAQTIAFNIAPRMNAVGRLADSMQVVELMLTDDGTLADELAKIADRMNDSRQRKQEQFTREAITMVEEEYADQSYLVLSRSNWEIGLVGLVAAKIAERFCRPTLVGCELAGGVVKGSGRTYRNFHLLNSISDPTVAPLFERFGGHHHACGFTTDQKRWPEIRERLADYAKTQDFPYGTKVVSIDTDIRLNDMSFDLYDDLQRGAPFGSANPAPVFASFGLMLSEVSTMSEGKHLKMRMSEVGGRVYRSAVSWHRGDIAEHYRQGQIVDMVYTIEPNVFRNKTDLQMLIQDIRPSHTG